MVEYGYDEMAEYGYDEMVEYGHYEMVEYDSDYESDGEESEEEIDEDVESWAADPKRLRELEELRSWFRSELKDPSAWTLQRVKSLIQSNRTFAAREYVRQWLLLVAQSTETPEEAELRLPHMGGPQDLPFHRALTWEEANVREFCFEREVEEKQKRAARLTILFLFPEAQTKGLSAGEKKRLFTIASRVWTVDQLRAEGLLWVLDKEYPHTREEVGRVREWANNMSEDFMAYTALYPPPIVVDY